MEPINMTHQNKIALVTGASRGIGQAIALGLAQQGAFVVGTATTEKGAESISAFLQEYNVKGCGEVLNIADAAMVKEFVERITQTRGAPAILVNNAGITRDNLMLRMKDEEWLEVINTNLNGTFYVTRACLKEMMKARWGRIINISSVVGSNGNPGQVNYAASKGAIDAFTKSLAKEIATRNVTVNAVAPGFIKTDMTGALNDKQQEMILQMIPANRVGEAAEVSAVVNFLATEQASYVTGQVVHVNGGMY
jgi:3-oxoacyl-[acyl-carrier protein] reductase